MTSDSSLEAALQALARFATPEILRGNLIRAGLLITAFETLRERITTPLVGFFARDWGPDGALESERYCDVVLSLHKKRFEASCLWFLAEGAITEQDLESIYTCRRHRNDIAHELLKYLVDPAHDIRIDLLSEITRLHAKIDRWWVMNIEIPANEEFDDVEVQEDEIQTGTMLAMNLICAVALESPPDQSRPDA